MYRAKLVDDEKLTTKILDEGMYHFVPNEEVADKIMESGYLKQASGSFISKAINSYGIISTACLFAGKPDINNFVKNISSTNTQTNPYVNPNIVTTAICVQPNSKEDLRDYKTRNISDGAVLYEGNCVIANENVSKQKLVPDLVRQLDGTPILNTKGEYSIVFRQATKEELEINENTGKENGNCKEDYLKYINLKAKERGYHTTNNVQAKVNNYFNSIIDQGAMEKEITIENIKNNYSSTIKNIFSNMKRILKNLKIKKIDNSVENVLEEYKIGMKNPFQDERFSKFIGGLEIQEGLKQLKLKDVLSDLNQSKEGKYLKENFNNLISNINGNGIHGKGHIGRVMINSVVIGKREGILENDKNYRIEDILINAAAFHDIGRIGNNGPHARRSAKKVKKMDLKFSDGTPYSKEDKKILMAVIESHEGKPEKINKMINKYKIINQEDIELTQKLSSILRDADALDRVRLDRVTITNTKTNLNPKYLQTNTAKQLMLQAYELEHLSKNISNMNKILEYNNKIEKTNSFDEKYKVDNIPTYNPSLATEKISKTKEDIGIEF